MARPNSREELKEWCLRRLGHPVIEINVDEDQLEDRIDEALQKYRDYHSDGMYRTYVVYQLSADDVANGYLSISPKINYVSKVFPITSSHYGSGDMFDIRYQFFLNSMGDLLNWAGEISYLYQMEQYLSLVDQQLNGTPQVSFVRKQNRVIIHGDIADGDLKEGDFVAMEVYIAVDPEEGITSIDDNQTYRRIYDDGWLKQYTTALFKYQWGANMIKFDGMQLPGGVTMNGRQIFEDALQDIDKLEESLRSTHEFPVDFFVG